MISIVTMSDGDSESKSKHGGKMPKLEGTVTFENGAKKFVVHLKAMRSYFKLHHNGYIPYNSYNLLVFS